MIRLGLASCCLTNMIRMAASLTLALFMSYPIDCAEDRHIVSLKAMYIKRENQKSWLLRRVYSFEASINIVQMRQLTLCVKCHLYP